MIKVFFAVCVLVLPGISVSDSIPGTSSPGGLSGYLFLPGSDVLPEDALRIQGRLDYINRNNPSGDFLVLPLNVAWGCKEGFELGSEIPFYLDDGTEENSILGDITAGCAWLYETARGGSALVIKGLVTLPTGLEGRDGGSELALGVSTSTTFRLFRLQASASYLVNGGKNPFKNHIFDYMAFSIGGSSYITPDFQIVGAVDGNTLGDLGLSGCGVLYVLDSVSLFGALRTGLSGGESFRLSAGVSWTGYCL